MRPPPPCACAWRPAVLGAGGAPGHPTEENRADNAVGPSSHPKSHPKSSVVAAVEQNAAALVCTSSSTQVSCSADASTPTTYAILPFAAQRRLHKRPLPPPRADARRGPEVVEATTETGRAGARAADDLWRPAVLSGLGALRPPIYPGGEPKRGVLLGATRTREARSGGGVAALRSSN